MKSKLFTLICSSTILATFASAADIYFGGTLGGDSKVTNNSWESSSVWVDVDKNKTEKVPTAADNVIFDQSYITYQTGNVRAYSTTFTVNKLTFQNIKGMQFSDSYAGDTYNIGEFNYIRTSTGGNLTFGVSTSKQVTIKVSGDFNAGKSTDTGVVGELIMGIGGNPSASGWGGPKSLSVGGNMNIYGTPTSFNIGVGSADGLSGNATYENPDIKIGGVLNMLSANGTNPTIKMNTRGSSSANSSYILNTVFAVGGLNGNGVLTNNTTRTDGKGLGKCSTALVFNNAAKSSYTYLGAINDDVYKTTVAGTTTYTKLVMRGEGTQILNGTTMLFTGGVEMLNGNLQLNYTDTTNHGNLTMSGGNFSNTADSTSKDAYFSKLIYTSGTIGSRWNGQGLDVINLSVGVFKGEDFVSGDSFLISLSGNLQTLLNNEQKILSWDNTTNATDFTADDFALTNGSGDFAIKNDGLYLTLMSVPEPAELAAIFGAIALAIAAYRRRK